MSRLFTFQFKKFIASLGVVLGIILAACAPAATQPAPTAAPTVAAPPSGETTAPPTEAAANPTETAAPDTSGQLRLTLAAEGNEARYRVREQLANFDLPNDAVGVTSSITGAIVLNAEGAIVGDDSKFVVDLTTLKSDQGMRDGYVQRNVLETRQYPTAEFVMTEAIGLPSPLPTSGAVAFQLAGDLTLHGVTRPTTWDVKAEIVNGQELVGSAVTSFTFGDFNLTIPRVARVLSIEDHIQLEIDFHLTESTQ